MVRLSVVDDVKITAVVSSSTFQIGDSRDINLITKVLAVQKEIATYQGHEGDLSIFDIYTRDVPFPSYKAENLQVNFHNEVPVIKVGGLRVISVASSSLVHIGSTESIIGIARVKHFRHYAQVPSGFRMRPELTIPID